MIIEMQIGGRKMHIRDFERLINGNTQPVEEVEAFWNGRARTFYETQKKSTDTIGEKVTRLLVEKNIIDSDTTILDIGAGSGRYTIPMAMHAKEVTALDLSESMLHFLQNELETLGVQNVKTLHSPWVADVWENAYMVTFAAMCPALQSVESLEAMSKAASRYGVIVRYIKTTDEVLKEYQKSSGNDALYKGDPHNSKETVQAYFNILWMLGYEPKIEYVDHYVDTVISKEQLLANYSKKATIPADDLHLLKEMVDKKSKEEILPLRKIYKLAILYWDTKRD